MSARRRREPTAYVLRAAVTLAPVDHERGEGAAGAPAGPPATRRIDREILRLAVPALGALVAEPLFLLGDAAVVARLGTEPLAGVAVAATVLQTVVGLCVFLAYGTTAAVARRLGAADRLGALRDGVAGLWLAVGLGLVLGVLGVALAPELVSWLGADDPSVAAAATTYLRISAVGLPAMLVVLAGTGVLRGEQDTRTPLVVSIVAASVNLALSAWWTLGLDWGVAGSAWATVAVQAGAALAYLLIIGRTLARGGFGRAVWHPATGDLLRAARDGIALLVRTAALRAVFLVSIVVAAAGGAVALAAYQLAYTTWSLLALVLDSLAIAAQALLAHSLGAGDAAAARALLRRLLAWGWWVGVALGLLVVVTRSAYVPLFQLEPQVADLFAATLLVVAVHQPVAGPAFVLDGVLIGAGDARWLAGAQTLMLAAFLPLAGWVAWTGGGLVALWLALLAWMVVRLALLWRRSAGDGWLVLGATR